MRKTDAATTQRRRGPEPSAAARLRCPEELRHGDRCLRCARGVESSACFVDAHSRRASSGQIRRVPPRAGTTTGNPERPAVHVEIAAGGRVRPRVRVDRRVEERRAGQFAYDAVSGGECLAIIAEDRGAIDADPSVRAVSSSNEAAKRRKSSGSDRCMGGEHALRRRGLALEHREVRNVGVHSTSMGTGPKRSIAAAYSDHTSGATAAP